MNKDKLLNCISKTNCWTAFRFDVYPVVKSKTTIKNRWELCENICRFLCFIFWKQNYWLSKNRSRFFLPLGSGGVFAFPFERDLLTWSVSLVIQACVNCYIFCTFLLNRVQNSEKKKINEHSLNVNPNGFLHHTAWYYCCDWCHLAIGLNRQTAHLQDSVLSGDCNRLHKRKKSTTAVLCHCC